MRSPHTALAVRIYINYHELLADVTCRWSPPRFVCRLRYDVHCHPTTTISRRRASIIRVRAANPADSARTATPAAHETAGAEPSPPPAAPHRARHARHAHSRQRRHAAVPAAAIMYGHAGQQHQLQDQPEAVHGQLVRRHLHVRVGVHQVGGPARRHVHGLVHVRLVLCAQSDRQHCDAAAHRLPAAQQAARCDQVQAVRLDDVASEFKVRRTICIQPERSNEE